MRKHNLFARIRLQDEAQRKIEGIAIPYNELNPLWRDEPDGPQIVFEPGSATTDNDARLTVQHDRLEMVGHVNWEHTPDALRFTSIISKSARGDQVMSDIVDKLITGASVEFIPRTTAEELRNKQEVWIIKNSLVDALSLVDRPRLSGARFEVLESLRKCSDESKPAIVPATDSEVERYGLLL